MRRAAVVIAVAAIVALARAEDPKPADPPPPLELVQTIALPGVKGRIDHFALDAKRKRLFVAALGNGSVEVVDLAKGERAKQIAGLKEPQGVAYLPETDQVVVACGEDGVVRFYSGDTFEPGATADLGDDADNVRYDAGTKRVYVGCDGGGAGGIAVIPTKMPVPAGKAVIGPHPEAFEIEKAGRRIFVNAEHDAEVAVVDRFEMTVKARWPLGGARANFPMALDEASKRLYVGCRAPASVVMLSTDDGKVVSKTACSEDPDDVFVDAKRNRVYVSCGAGAVDVFDRSDTDHLKLLAKVETRHGARTAWFDVASDRLYVAVPVSGDKDAEIRVFAPR